MQEEHTSNGVRYKWDLAGPNGASFIVFKDNHSDKEVKHAIREIRNDRDVVALRQASKYDLFDDYWLKLYRYADTILGLHWTQIDRDEPEIWNAMRTGKTPQQYVDSKVELWKSKTFNISE